jgi:predicted Ser/Thr protein kinase
MATTSCPDDRELLPAALGQTVPEDLRAHLDTCPECTRRVARMRVEVRALREVPSTVEDTRLPGADASTRTDPELEPAPPGSTPAAVGKYPVVGRLGGGGQGEVYRAVHPELGQDLVIKLARQPLGPGGIDRDLLAAEGRLLAELRHDNLVRVYDLGVHDGRVFLAMEFVRGCTLEQYAERGKLAPRQAAAVVAELARAVAYLHGRGVVHQDLKPRNVLIDEEGRPRLIDFGLARLRDAWAGDADGPSGGTLAYMAPEQARGEAGKAGPAADVFALGAVLYFLLTGHSPFVGRDTAEVWDRARRGDFDRAALGQPGVPRRLARVALRAMALDPEARYPTAEALAADLGAFLRRPRLVAAQAGVLLLAATAAGAWALRPRPAGDTGRTAPQVPTAPAPTPEPAPLRVESFQVELHRQDPAAYLGLVGVNAFAGRFDPERLKTDAVRVRARLSAPGYCYLVALNPDGQVQPCSPEDPAAAPPRADEVVYPSDPGAGFRLTDGAGLQAFVLVASRAPLPPLADWLREAGTLPWAKTEAASVWRYDGRAFESNTERGEVGPLADLPKPLEAACRSFQSRPGVDAIRALAFPVEPRPGSKTKG